MMNRTLESSKNESERKGEELSLLRDTVEELRVRILLCPCYPMSGTRAAYRAPSPFLLPDVRF
eukprot:2702948-Rhodomonas_salina.1